MLGKSGKKEEKDKKFDTDVTEQEYANRLFTRLVAKGKRFERVDFRYCTFDASYLRDCVFDSCDFTGCRFVSCMLQGSSFSGCKFDYATFERTLVDIDVLDNNAPAFENLKLRFARTLRMNFQQIGDSESVNKAIQFELQAIQTHLHKSWACNEQYYRRKYKGMARVGAYFRWLKFRFLDVLWGNGESTAKLIRSAFLLVGVVSLIDVWHMRDPMRLSSYSDAFCCAPQLLLGTADSTNSTDYSKGYLAFLVFFRLVAMALFLSVIIKRFNRR